MVVMRNMTRMVVTRKMTVRTVVTRDMTRIEVRKTTTRKDGRQSLRESTLRFQTILKMEMSGKLGVSLLYRRPRRVITMRKDLKVLSRMQYRDLLRLRQQTKNQWPMSRSTHHW
jgi:hypothetical protein